MAHHPGNVLLVEPNIKELPKGELGGATLVDQEFALETVDVVVLLVDHKPFKSIPSDRVQPDYLVDSRGVWESR